jgi:hypothetical protein
MGSVATAEHAIAEIHYSGPINQFFSGDYALFHLDQYQNRILFSHSGNAGGGVGAFFAAGVYGASVAGIRANAGFRYASKLGSNINLNNLAAWVFPGGGLAAFGGHTYSQWKTPGTGFVGFRFSLGGPSNFYYGWARLTVDGTPGNTFTLVDFAWADGGDQIATGQTVVPEPGSLGLLAVGAAGLLALRKRRAIIRIRSSGGRVVREESSVCG